jgi:hypothetical protein
MKVAGAPTSSVGRSNSTAGLGTESGADGATRTELGCSSGAAGAAAAGGATDAGAASGLGTLGLLATGTSALSRNAGCCCGAMDSSGGATDNGALARTDGRTDKGTDGGTLSDLSGRLTARRFTTVGRIRSSTIDGLFCFSMCLRTRSTNSGSTELIWLRTSPKPIDWNKATSAFCSMPSSFATS